MRVWRSRALPPADLLRLACDRCDTYEDAKRVLGETPLCLPALCALADVRPGDGRIIERLSDGAAAREMPAAIANHWLPCRGAVARAAITVTNGQQQMEGSASGKVGALVHSVHCEPPDAPESRKATRFTGARRASPTRGPQVLG